MYASRRGTLAAAVLSLSLLATPAVAQLCVGVPLNVGQTSLALRADFPEDVNVFGVRAANRISGPLVVGASYALASPDDGDSEHRFGVDLALDLPLAPLANMGAALCPVAGVFYQSFDGGNLINIPFGAALGAALGVSDGISVAPFVIPQFVHSRLSLDAIDETVTDTEFDLSLGANLLVENLFFGLLVGGLVGEDTETLFGVQAGIVF